MKESSFNSEIISDSPFCWWMGQIVDDSVWKNNGLPSKWMGPEKIPGWGTRYKVRIFGRDSASKEVPDEQLDWAEVLFPVTAGSGHGGSYESANLKKGAFVFGFYKDGIDKSEPIIMGCVGNSDQTKLSQKIPNLGFVPFSGYIGERVSVNSIPGEGSYPPPSGTEPLESVSQSNVSHTCISDQQQKDDGCTEQPLSSSSDCNKTPLGKIRIAIKNFIKAIQEFKKQLTSWKNTILKPIKENGQEFSLSEYILYKAQNVAKLISGEVRRIINGIEQFIKTKIFNAAKDLYFVVFPNQRNKIRNGINTAWDLITCLFRKIVSNLLKMITDMLLKIAERFINAPLCAIENIISSLLGQLLGFITNGIEAILKPLEAIIGGVFDLAEGVLGFIIDVLSFLSCDEPPVCPDVEGWTPWEGATTFKLGSSITNIINKAKDIASKAKGIVDVDNFDFNLNFDNIFEDTCNVGPIFCGPPTVEFYGGGGSGASGNAIISAAGDILGVDITGFGSGYTSAPAVRFVDACGKGRGAVGRAILGKVPLRRSQGTSGGTGTGETQGTGTEETGETTTGVVQVLIENPGFGYLSTPNGDRGGDGSVWATKDQTTVKRKDGTYDRAYNPGETFTVNPGDEVYSNGNTQIIENTGEYTAPTISETVLPRGDNPSLNNGKYPVFLELDDVAIDSPGINYDPTKDKIIITPDNGAKLEPIFDSLGSLRRVNVLRSGIGFTEMPEITIETESGYNATLLPRFKINRLGDIPDGQDTQVPQTQIISVIDCVGKIYG